MPRAFATRAPLVLIGQRQERSCASPQALSHAITLLQSPPPALVLQIPVDGAPETFLQCDAGPPAQFASYSVRVDGVSEVMPGPVLDEGDLRAVAGRLGPQFIEDRANRADDIA